MESSILRALSLADKERFRKRVLYGEGNCILPVSCGNALQRLWRRVRMELGGRFYHFGVVVWPTGSAADFPWWQRALGWPPEVMVYHEE